jgi:hypothetical protein
VAEFTFPGNFNAKENSVGYISWKKTSPAGNRRARTRKDGAVNGEAATFTDGQSFDLFSTTTSSTPSSDVMSSEGIEEAELTSFDFSTGSFFNFE